jgi:hypothetical protein
VERVCQVVLSLYTGAVKLSMPTACGQAMIEGRHLGPFGSYRSVGHLRQAGPQSAIALASLCGSITIRCG